MPERNGTSPSFSDDLSADVATSTTEASDGAAAPGARRIIVLTAPSGAGKSTIAERVLEAEPRLSFSVSVTTRAPRPGETPGEDYYFISQDDFEAKRDAGELLEYEEVYAGRYYGTLASEVEAKAQTGGVLLVLDVRGALHVKTRYDDEALIIFIAPPSMDVLARRLRGRATESDAAVAERLTRAEVEMTYATRCDAIVVNDDLDTAVEETLEHVRAFIDS